MMAVGESLSMTSVWAKGSRAVHLGAISRSRKDQAKKKRLNGENVVWKKSRDKGSEALLIHKNFRFINLSFPSFVPHCTSRSYINNPHLSGKLSEHSILLSAC